EICCLRKRGYTQLALANKFKIGESTVSKILKQQDYFLSIDPNSTQAKSKQNRSAKYPQLEKVLSLWVSKAEANYQTITDAIIQRKAFQFAEKLKIDNFGGSKGWLANFKKRFHIKEYIRQEESASALINDIPRYCDELKDIIKEYHPKIGPVHGKKKAKDQVTVLVTCNSTGDDKLPLLLIYKYQNPHAIRCIDKTKLPVYYYWNSSSWMQLSIFNHYIKKLNEQMRKAGRKILLLMDQASPHTLEERF
ncbi:10180_t:CDS:2, partial [Racocetra persica]